MRNIDPIPMFEIPNYIILLDSSIIFHHFYMNSSEFVKLFDYIDRTEMKIVFPKVVIEETINNYATELRELVQKISREHGKLTALLKDFECSLIDTEDRIQIYKQYLENFININGEILPYPKCEHSNLANKAILRKKPFNDKGGGYRDALIWESVKSLLERRRTIVFITKNHRDFLLDSEDQLHSDLCEELELNQKVICFRSLQEFNNHLDTIYDKHNDVFSDDLKKVIDNWFSHNIHPLIRDNKDWGPILTGLPEDAGSYFLSKVDEITNMKLLAAHKTLVNEYLLKIEIVVKINAWFSISKDDFEEFEEIREYIGSIWDFNGTPSFSQKGNISLVANLIFEPEEKTVRKCEIIEISSDISKKVVSEY